MIIDIPPAIHYTMPEAKESVLGSAKLFEYANGTLKYTYPFEELLKLLVEIGQLDEAVLKATTLEELNALLQKGLLRKEGTERWDMEDNGVLKAHQGELERLFDEIGLVKPQPLEGPLTVNYCMVFGASVERMQTRILATGAYLASQVEVKDHIFLLGSYRQLIPREIQFLHKHLENLDADTRAYWRQVFIEAPTEANACVFLWETLVPPELQDKLHAKLVPIKSTRIGASYRDEFGHRPTTEVTCEDWSLFYNPDEPQTLFAVIEQPYIRLADQLRFTTVSDKRNAPLNIFLQRLHNTRFYFAVVTVDTPPLISVVLDEIGRHVYRITQAVKYLDFKVD